MGRVVPFHPRPEAVSAKAEAILSRISQLHEEKMKAKEELPSVLARLAESGQTELVLRAITMWGSGEREPNEVLSMCEAAASSFAADD